MTEQWLVALAAGIGLGWLLGWLFGARKATRLEVQLEESENRLAEERSFLDSAQKKLSDTFKALAADVLRQNNEGFLALAKEKLGAARNEAASDLEARKEAITTLVTPLAESLKKMERQVQELETARSGAYGDLTQQLRSLAETGTQLRSETASLVSALRAPKVRGRWGEIQLRRVVELAGMLNHCDFFPQESVSTEDGMLRPDLRVQLPGGRNVVVDSKVPLDAYLQALQAQSEEERSRRLAEHARQVRARMDELSSKRYWQALQATPEFVVLFLPAESFYDAALQFDPSLIEDSAMRQVILATPTTLIALLKAVAYGWKEQQVEENARKVSREGQELYERIGKVAEYLGNLGSALKRAVDEFNSAVGSFETRLLVSARRLKELGAAAEGEVPELAPIGTQPRELMAVPATPTPEKVDA